MPDTAPSPLRPVEFFLLTALDREPLHGYALVEAIDELTQGRMTPRPGDLYRVLHRLERRGLVEIDESLPRRDEDERRTYYRLTELGSNAVRAEAELMSRVASRVLRERLTPT